MMKLKWKINITDFYYDSLCCLAGQFKISSAKELSEIVDILMLPKRYVQNIRVVYWSDIQTESMDKLEY